MQKLLLLADPNGRERCVGKEVDDFLELEAIPNVMSLDDWANRTMQHIRKLANEGIKESDPKNEVKVEIAGNKVWETLMGHIQLSVKKEGIEVKISMI